MNKRLTDIYFIRHAEPNYNNHDDMTRELSPKGMKDRELVTEFLADKQVDIVLSSPYKRAVDTVAHFASLHDLPVTPIFDFRERKVDSCWIDDFDAFTRNQWVDFNYKLTDGETLAEVQKRNIAALQKAVEQHKSKTIVVGWPGGKFCVSVFRQNQEYHIINVHDGAYSPWLHPSRKVGAVCAPRAA